MDLTAAIDFIRTNRQGVLTTIRRDGRPQLSNIIYAVDELVELYRSLSGEHDDWDEYRDAMVRDQRIVLRITPASAYGMLPS